MHGYRLNMEDAHIIIPSLSTAHPEVGLFAVFDGHAGERAALFLAAELHKRVCELSDPTNEEQLKHCVQKLDADFLTDAKAREDGSTCTFCIVSPARGQPNHWEVIAVNVGDSRSALVKPDGTVVSLTEDHKPQNQEEIARIIAAGGTVSMNRVDSQLAMSRAIGDWQYKSNPTLKPEAQKVTAVPTITKAIASPNDILLICCDGIVEQMNNEDAGKFVREDLNTQKSEKKKVDLALTCASLNKYSLQRGSKDNHSALLIAFEDGTNYNAKDEFIAGPYHPYRNDKSFSDAYLADAKKHGFEGEQLMEMARRTEATLPDPGPSSQAANSNNPLSLALQEFMGNTKTGDVNEKIKMLSSMLSRNAMPGMGDEDDDEAGP